MPLQQKSIRISVIAFILPLLTAWYPGIYLYGNNITKLVYPSLLRIMLLYAFISIVVYLATLLLLKGEAYKAADAAFILLIFFNGYGLIFNFLIKKDLFRLEHFTFLPFVLIVSFYFAWLITRFQPDKVWRYSVVFVGILVGLNLIKIIPAEVIKSQANYQKESSGKVLTSEISRGNYPDIYFIIFDEFAGFNSMEGYWNYQGVDDFVDFAENKGFYVALNSKSSSLSTFHQIVERLNYTSYPKVDVDDVNIYFDEIVNNNVMNYLKTKGYTIVVFEETEHFFGGFPKMKADYTFEYDSNKMTNLGIVFDNFGILVSDNTMLLAFSKYYKIVDPTLAEHRDWLNFTAEQIARLEDIPSPKFVYVHLILPHTPFMFDENGNKVDPKFYYNWNYYFGNYKYAIRIATRMINNLLPDATSSNPAVIVIQSDHGARNIASGYASVSFPDFPEEYKYDIMNMMYLPGFDYEELSQDMKPINTFPLIFNHYFGDTIPFR